MMVPIMPALRMPYTLMVLLVFTFEDGDIELLNLKNKTWLGESQFLNGIQSAISSTPSVTSTEHKKLALLLVHLGNKTFLKYEA